jgi:GMP synthase (glutamine-hydrolysing)
MAEHGPRVALLDAALDSTHTRRNFRREVPAELVAFDVTTDTPATYEFDGVVVTGSAASVYESRPWIGDLLDWLRAGIDRGLPMLGVCFGHQALATALGGQVKGMGEYEIGVCEIRRTDDSMLLADLDERFTAFSGHQDIVTELPEAATLTARNEFGVQGFEAVDVFGVQFHPEFDLETARYDLDETDLPAAKEERVRTDLTPERYAAAARSSVIFDAFVDYLDGEHSRGRAAGASDADGR